MTDAHSVARDQLRAFIERIERLEEEKKTIADDIKDVKSEAKGCGFDVGIINAIVKLRKIDPNERAEHDALLDTYMIALGMLPDYGDDTENTASAGSPSGPTSPAESEPEEISAPNSPETATEQRGNVPPQHEVANGQATVQKSDVTGGESAAGSEGSRQSALVSELAGRGNASDKESETVVGTESGTVTIIDRTDEGGNHVRVSVCPEIAAILAGSGRAA